MLAKPLRDVSGQSLWPYVSGLFYTVGSSQDFRYLLPRIFEVSVTDPGNSNNPEIVLRKLRLGEWWTWPETEQAAVSEFVDAWFEHALCADLAGADEGYVGWDAESVLCGAALAGMSLEPWLLRLQKPDAAALLADQKSRYPKQLSSFWENAPDAFRQLVAILA